MMGRQSGQMSMVILEIAELIPSDHLLRKINQMISFDFIYDLVAPYYPANGRPSVDPVSMFKMLPVGYLYGIKSERRLVQEIQLNIAYIVGFVALSLEKRYRIILHSAKQESASGMIVACSNRSFWKLSGAAWSRN